MVGSDSGLGRLLVSKKILSKEQGPVFNVFRTEICMLQFVMLETKCIITLTAEKGLKRAKMDQQQKLNLN